MNNSEFIELLEIHGPDPAHWPEESVDAISQLLAENPEAIQALLQFQEMDSLLMAMPAPEFTGLEERIAGQSLAGQGSELIERIIHWLLPAGGFSSLWRPAMAACLPLFFGVMVGSYSNFGLSRDTDTELYWEDELAMLSLADYSENQIDL